MYEPSLAIQKEKANQKMSTLSYLWLHEFVDKVYDPLGVLVSFGLPIGIMYFIDPNSSINYSGIFWSIFHFFFFWYNF